MNTYVTWVEENEWEGETWRFYIPRAGNETALMRLKAWVDQHGDSSANVYRLNFTPLLEDEVDRRVRDLADDTSYLAAHTKLEGRLVTQLDTLTTDDLYKGGIKNLLVTDARHALDELVRISEDMGLYDVDETAVKRQDDQNIHDFYVDAYDEDVD